MEQRMELLPGVWLCGVQTRQFKGACLSFNLLRPLRQQEASKNALLANVLMQGCEKYPDMQSISLALDQLYGAGLGPLVRKNGEIQTCGFYLSFLEERFAMDGDKILEPMLELLGQILLKPCTEHGAFRSDIVELEKENLISIIASSVNDKRAYAAKQMLKAMCKDDGFGISRLGEIEDVKAITPENLYAHYRMILETSPIEIFYAGSTPLELVGTALRRVLKDLPRGTLEELPFAPMPRRQQVQYLEETMDLTQGKLSMGFTTGVTTKDPLFVPMMVFNALFGGDMTSKLFLNVREKLSLCYYANSGMYGAKGIITVSCGIETANYEKAKNEILLQLEACQKGDISNEELESAKEAMRSSLVAIPDSTGRMEDYHMFCLLSGFTLEPKQYLEAVQKVTIQDVVEAAKQVSLDTIFFLKGAAQ